METSVANPYLTGNFAPVRDERDDADLEVTGSLPPELDGLLAAQRSQPDRRPRPDERTTGSPATGCCTASSCATGRRRYRNRWVRTDGACEALGGRAGPGQPDDVFLGGSSAANTRIVRAHGDESSRSSRCASRPRSAPTYGPSGAVDFDGALRSAMTAHPKIDPLTGEILFFGYDIMGPPWLRFHVVDATGALVTTEDDHHRRPGDGARLRDHDVARRLARPARRLRPLDARHAAVPGRVGRRATRRGSA